MGVQFCYIKKGNVITPVKKGETIYVKNSDNIQFYIDETCLSADTKNKIATLEDAKWAYIYSYFWNTVSQKKKDADQLWGSFEGSEKHEVDSWGKIGYKKGKNVRFNFTGSTYYYGYKQRVEIFNYSPGSGFFFYIVPLKEKDEISFISFSDSDKVKHYGDTIGLNVLIHGYNIDSSKKKYKAIIYILEESEAKGLKTTSELKEKNLTENPQEVIIKYEIQNEHNHNLYSRANILIDPTWQKGSKQKKIYTAVIEIYEAYTEKHFIGKNTEEWKRIDPVYNFADNPVKDLSRYDSELLDIKDVEHDRKVNESFSSFIVSEELMDHYLTRIEQEKTNMIQYIGDIAYNRKENNPCAFSIITVNNGEKDIEIFNEYKLGNSKVEDSTGRWVDIVNGDKDKKTVKITAKFLKSKDAKPESVKTANSKVLCQKILNDGHLHKDINDVFKMDWIIGQWMPVTTNPFFNLLNNSNPYLPTLYHPSNALLAPKIEPKYKDNQEAKGIPVSKEEQQKYQTVTVAQVQRLTNDDYKIDKATDSISLFLKYHYNKSYPDEVTNYLFAEQSYLDGGFVNDNVKNLWVVRYLLKWIKNEPMEQIYFVPVTTCRYPNQLAKIRVFPDMKWVLNFNYNIETPIYYKSTTALETYYSGFNEGSDITTANSNRRRGIIDSNTTNILQPYVGRKTSFGLSVECEVSGEDDVIKLGKDFAEKYRRMLSPLLWIVNKLDGDMGVSAARNDQANIRSRSSGLMERLNKLPMSFELTPPKLGVGLGIGYATSEKGVITYELDGRLIADPIIGASVKLDILALGSKFKPWGLIIDALDLISWATNLFSGGQAQLEYELYFKLTAEIKLVGTDSKDGETQPANITYNFADKKYKGDIALQGKLEGAVVMNAMIKVKLKMERGRDMVQYRTEENNKRAFELGIEATAVSYVTLTLGKNFGGDGNWTSDFYFSGVNVYVKVKFGFKGKETKLEKLIPDLDKKIDIFKNEGEVK